MIPLVNGRSFLGYEFSDYIFLMFRFLLSWQALIKSQVKSRMTSILKI